MSSYACPKCATEFSESAFEENIQCPNCLSRFHTEMELVDSSEMSYVSWITGEWTFEEYKMTE